MSSYNDFKLAYVNKWVHTEIYKYVVHFNAYIGLEQKLLGL